MGEPSPIVACLDLTERERGLILGWIYILQTSDQYRLSDEENSLIDKFTAI